MGKVGNRKITNNLKLIIVFLALFFLAGLYLFWQERRHHDPQFEKEWTAVYFLDPASDSLDFAIENYEGQELEYQWELKDGAGQIKETGAVKLAGGAKQEVKLTEKRKAGEVSEIQIHYGDQDKFLRKL